MSRDQVKFYNSIGVRLSAVIATIIFLSVTVLSVVNANQSLDREAEHYRSLIRGAASAYAASVADPVVDRDRVATLSSLRGIRDLPNVIQVDVHLSDGQSFAELGSGAWIVSEPGNETSLWRVDHMRVELPIMKSGAEVGRLGMLVSIAPLRQEILRNLYATLFSALIVSLLGILFSHRVVSRVTSPIRDLTSAMSGFRAGEDNLVPALKRRTDETGILTQSFEDMIERIAERDQRIAHQVETLEDTVEARTHDLRMAKEDAEAANAAKSDFLATMSHEIRTPMNGMMVMAEMLGAADLTPRHRRYAEIIHRSGSSLLTIINDILDLSKIEAGQLDLESIPVSPENLVADIASLFWERARGKGLELATYVAPQVPMEILTDPTRLNQIVSNLVNNALKFTERGGVLIRIDAENVSSETSRLIIEVVDTGIGIPEDKIDRIFESFSQADQSTTRRFGGTGLGLSVCQRLVTAMQGDITVRSKPGHGSTFRVEIPAPVEAAALKQDAINLRVGLALPEGLISVSIEQSLVDAGCQVVAENPDVWLTNSDLICDQSAPSVLLTDIGDTQSDTLLKSGRAVDVLHTPYRRADLVALLERAQLDAFLGVNAGRTLAATRTLQSFEGVRVLAADDNAVNREVLREALSTLKADAVFVKDGALAVEAMREGCFDLVFMDGSMPVMDGFEATRRIREMESETERARTPIYALTAQVAGAGDGAWTEAGADGHILKPFTLEKLAQVLSGVEKAPTVDTREEAKPASAPLLDMETIASLEQLGGGSAQVRDKVWTMFNDKAVAMLTALHEAMDGGASEDVAKHAHAFKSMALSAGLSGIAERLESIEVAAKSVDQWTPSPEHKAGLDSLVAETQSEMLTYRAAST